MTKLFALSTLLLVQTLSSEAPAQRPDVTPPKLLEDAGAAYPEAALTEGYHRPAEVVLILELDETGRVRNARVEQAVGHGFDEAALAAVERLRFEPATRGGVPVAARIRYKFRFAPPPPPPEPEEPSTSIAPRENVEQEPRAPTVAPEPAAPLEITVQGEVPSPGTASYTRGEVRQIPGAFGDPFRAIETLPGVTPLASGLPYFYVRGSPPGNVGYLLDGVRVPALYHVGFGPSVVHPGIVERVDLYPGGYPARFGRFTGGIVSAETPAPRTDAHGEGNLRLFDVGALVEAGFAGERGTVLVGGRYSYTAALLSLIAPSVRLDYRDYQARISYDLTPSDRVSLFSFGSFDLLALERNGLLDILYGTEFYRADLRYDRALPAGKLRTAITAGYDRSSAGFIAGERRNIRTRSLRGRVELESELGPDVRVRAGADVQIEEHRVERPSYTDPDSPETQTFDALFSPRIDKTTGAWVDFVLHAAKGVEIVPGVRADLYVSDGAQAIGIDPRVAARFAVTRALRIIHAHGLVHQAPSFALPVPGLTPATLADGLQRSVQTSAGAELDLDEDTTASATLFHNLFFAMSDALGTAERDGPPDFAARGDGRAYGVELYLKRRLTRRLGGFIAYTLARSTREREGRSSASAADRTHVANAAVSYDLGRAWRAGGRGVFYTGAPAGDAASRSGQREPPFFRLDVRVEKRWSFDQRRFIALVIEVMNATLNRETLAGEEFGPVVIPSVGMEVGF